MFVPQQMEESGVFLLSEASITMRSTLVRRNSGTFDDHGELIGGGLYLRGPADAVVEACRFHDNEGDGVLLWAGFARLMNCELAGNHQSGVSNFGASVFLTNSTVTENLLAG